MPGLFDRFGRPRREEAYIGSVFNSVNTAIDDAPRRFTPESVKLNDVIIQVLDNAQAFGNNDTQDYEVEAGEVIGFTRVDISALYFRNLVAGQNGTVIILGVRQ